MNNPPDRKSLKVSTRVHSRVHQVASELSTSAAEAIGLLVDPSTVCLPLSPEQHARWTRYAEASGISLAEWITHRVEAAIQYGTDQGTMAEVLKGVRALLARTAPPPPPRRPLKPKETP
jgi:predicted HicB family RNase H-like nuclease